MVEHLVWFKLKEGITQDEKATLMQSLRDLKNQVPDILQLAVGEDFSGRSRGFEMGLVVRFPNRQALEIYGPHPSHEAFIEKCKHLWVDVQALDFETE